MKRKTTSLFYSVVISRLIMITLLSLLSTLSYAQQTRLLNTTAPATAWGAITFRLTTTATEIRVDTIFVATDGTASNLEVWYKPTGLNAQPLTADFGPPTQLWFNVIASQAVSSTTTLAALVIPNGLVIPANSQYGIYIGNTSYATTGVKYASTVPTPDSVFNSQVSIRSGTNTGFGWVRNGTTTNTPRAFCGGISYSIPVHGPNNASISNLVSPTLYCAGATQDIKVRLRNRGTNIINNVTVNWTLDGVLQTPIAFASPLDTIGSTTLPSDTVLTLGSPLFGLTPRIIKVWSSMPNSVVDTSNGDDTITVTKKPSLSGTYTVGGTSPNYPNLVAAAAALNEVGVCGPVIFDVRAGTYSGQVSLTGVVGVSATNTITFIGANKATTIVTNAFVTGEYATWVNDNVSYVTLRNLTINATHATNAWGIRLNSAHNNKIINCNVNAPVYSSSTSMGIVIAGSPTSYSTAGRADSLTIDSTTVTGGYMSICSYGASTGISVGLKVTNTSLIDHYYAGIYLYYNSSVFVSNNKITHLNPTAATYGMYLSSLGNASGVANTFTNNYVNSICSYGIYFTTATNPSATNKGVIANNVVRGMISTYGIYMTAGTNWTIAHNTSFFQTNATTITYVPAYITGGSAIACFNNIFRTLSTSAYSFYGSAATIFDTLNYNVYSKDVKGANYFYLGAAYTDVTMIGAGSRNANSVSLNPDFTNDSVLITKRSCLSGIAIPSVATDINGSIRNVVSPTMGAYEVTPVAVDARVEGINQPLNLAVLGLQDAAVLIRNEGTTTLTSVNVTIRVNARPPVTVLWSGSLAQCDTVSVPFTGSNQITFDKVSKIVAYTSNPNLGTDLRKNNDTLKVDMIAPMIGTYTIGGTGADFANIVEAATNLRLAGVVGAVTFNINPGTYSGQVNLNLISGVSATNTITFIGANKATTIVTHNAVLGDYATWTIDGISYVTLRNFTINGTNATNAFGIRLHNAHNCKIINCDVNVAVVNVTTSVGIVVSGSGTSYSTAGRADNLEIDSVKVTGGYFCITNYGATAGVNAGLKLTNTQMIDYYYYGLYLVYNSSVTVSNNAVTHLNSTPSTYGMYLSSLSNAGGIANTFTNNTVNSIGTAGMYFTTAANPSATNKGVIANNVITGSYTSYGLYMTTGTNWRIAHNSFLNNNTSATTTVVPAYITGGSAIACFNNIFRTRSSTTGYTFYGSAATIFDTLNYNVYSKDLKGTNYFYLGAAYTDATMIGAGSRNANSVSSNPVFMNETTGNLTPLSSNIDNIGIVASNLITSDITGALRSTTTPDPGAYEFTGVPGDIAITDASAKRSSACYATSDTVFVSVRNVIGSTIDFAINPLTINWSSTGPVASSGSITISSGTLAPDVVTTVYSTTFNGSLPGNYSLKAYISSNAVNLSALNDTLATVPFIVKSILSVSPKTITVNTSTATVALRASSTLFPGGGVFFSEIAHYKVATGAPAAGWPSYLTTDDYVEITGVPNSDLAGYIMEEWSGTGATAQYTHTFVTGTLFSPNGTMIVATGQLTGSVPSPANFYYHTSYSGTPSHSSTGDLRGYVIKNSSGTVIDATVYGAYTFPAASGVTTADWSGTTPEISSSGNTLSAPDNNTGTCWVNSGTILQTPNALNAGISVPIPGSLTGFDWSYLGSSFSTSPNITVGPYTVPGVYKYVASYTNTCGTFYDTAYVTAGASVPVKLTSFTATKANADVNLNWNTASEVNNSHFEIEKSENGRDFKAIGRVKGNGTTSKPNRYAFVDENATNTAARTLYYRLKQVDNDGSSTYSKTEVVTLSDKRISGLSTHPNPSTGVFTISAEIGSTSAVNMKVVNIMGANVWSQTVNPVMGANAFDTQLQLPNGVYMLLFEQNGETSTHKFVITH